MSASPQPLRPGLSENAKGLKSAGNDPTFVFKLVQNGHGRQCEIAEVPDVNIFEALAVEFDVAGNAVEVDVLRLVELRSTGIDVQERRIKLLR